MKRFFGAAFGGGSVQDGEILVDRVDERLAQFADGRERQQVDGRQFLRQRFFTECAGDPARKVVGMMAALDIMREIVLMRVHEDRRPRHVVEFGAQPDQGVNLDAGQHDQVQFSVEEERLLIRHRTRQLKVRVEKRCASSVPAWSPVDFRRPSSGG